MWDRVEDAWDDEEIGTIAELKSEIESLEEQIRAAKIPLDEWVPPWRGKAGFIVKMKRQALSWRVQELEQILAKGGRGD